MYSPQKKGGRELTESAFFCLVNSYSSFKTQITLHSYTQFFQQSSDGSHYLPVFTASTFVPGYLLTLHQ